MYDSYEHYYESNIYNERYPQPNRHSMRVIQTYLTQRSIRHVLDVGAGSGRYTLPLLQDGAVNVSAVERSASARERLVTAAANLPTNGRLRVFRDVDEVPLRQEGIGCVLMMFGVLAHMDHTERQSLLGKFGALSESAVIVGSVPSKIRRFRAEQREAVVEPLGSTRIRYYRTLAGTTSDFQYSLFTRASLETTLRSGGWEPISISAESVLPESAVTRSRLLGIVDARISSFVSPVLGYGLLFAAVHCRRAATRSAANTRA